MALELDGVILEADGSVLGETSAALRDAAAMGYILGVVTDRSLEETYLALDGPGLWGLVSPFRFLVVANHEVCWRSGIAFQRDWQWFGESRGAALAYVAEAIGIRPEGVLVIVGKRTPADLEALQVAAVSNAPDAVKAEVKRRGGALAHLAHGRGAAELLRALPPP